MSSARRWIVRAGDETGGVDAVALRMGPAGRGAVESGRAFVNGVRAATGASVKIGDMVEVWAARPVAVGTDLEPTILAQRGEVLFALKPASLPTEPERRGGDALVTRLARLLGVQRVHAASRLDLGVSGVVACATGPLGTTLLARARESGRYRRVYLAIAGGHLEGQGTWDGAIEGRRAQTAWATRGGARDATWLELELDTGRTHQIRIHAKVAEHPLIGDKAYGGRAAITAASGSIIEPRRIMLHAVAARLELPAHEGGPFEATAPVPDEMRSLWRALDGAPAAWEEWRAPWSPSSPSSPSSPPAPPPPDSSATPQPR